MFIKKNGKRKMENGKYNSEIIRFPFSVLIERLQNLVGVFADFYFFHNFGDFSRFVD